MNQNQKDQDFLFQERTKKGKLPLISIDGTDFVIDLRMRTIRLNEFPFNNISLDMMEENENGKGYGFFYDRKTKDMWKFDADITELPADVIAVAIPAEVKMDPVAVAREKMVDPKKFVQKHPITPSLTARIIQISQTSLPGMVEYNKSMQTVVSGHHEPVKNNRPAPRR